MYCQKAINASKLNNLEENKLMLQSEFKGRLILCFQKNSIHVPLVSLHTISFFISSASFVLPGIKLGMKD